MSRSIRAPIALAILLSLSATACTEAANEARQTAAEAAQTAADVTAEAAAEGGAISEAIAEAREKLRTENLPLGDVEGLPKAELTPQGDLLIDGKALALSSAQRDAVVAYRTEVLAVADAGMVLGEKGAGIAGDALALAAKSVFGGSTSEAEARIEAQGKAMEAEAQRLCQRVAELETAQARLVAVLPAFQPYAKAQNIDVDCNVESTADDATSASNDNVST